MSLSVQSPNQTTGPRALYFQFICPVFGLHHQSSLHLQLKLHLAYLLHALNGFLNIYHVNFFTERGFLLIYTPCYFQLKCIVQKIYECLSHTVPAGDSKTRKEDRIAMLEATSASKMGVRIYWRVYTSQRRCKNKQQKRQKRDCVLLHQNTRKRAKRLFTGENDGGLDLVEMLVYIYFKVRDIWKLLHVSEKIMLTLDFWLQ